MFCEKYCKTWFSIVKLKGDFKVKIKTNVKFFMLGVLTLSFLFAGCNPSGVTYVAEFESCYAGYGSSTKEQIILKGDLVQKKNFEVETGKLKEEDTGKLYPDRGYVILWDSGDESSHNNYKFNSDNSILSLGPNSWSVDSKYYKMGTKEAIEQEELFRTCIKTV